MKRNFRGTMMMNHGMRVPNGMRQDGSDFLLDRFCLLNLYHICGDSVVERQNQRTCEFKHQVLVMGLIHQFFQNPVGI
jgi:hypothetical protein